MALSDGREALLFPLVAGGELQAALALDARPEAAEDPAALLEPLLSAAANAARIARLVETLDAERAEADAARRREAAAREAERARLARELHDGAVQDVLSLRHRLLERAAEPATGDDEESFLAREARALQATADRLREHVRALRPQGPTGESGLAEALERFARRLADEHAGECPAVTVSVAPGLRLSLLVETCLFRVAQEALRNAAHHARCRRVDVRVEAREGQTILTARDDGVGFPRESTGDLPSPESLAAGGHYGLAGAAERLAALGGSLQLRTAPEGGAEVLARLPLGPVSGEEVSRDA